MAGGQRLRWLETMVRVRVGARTALVRGLGAVPAVVQIAAAALAAYAIAFGLLGHAFPLVAVIVTITALGISRDARPRQVLETVIGINVGIAIAGLLVSVIGRGAWQIAVVIAVTLLIARTMTRSIPFAIAAAVQSTIVVVLPDPAGGIFERSLDGLVGGAMALAATALIPRWDIARSRPESRALFSLLDQSFSGMAASLERGDEAAGDLALARARRTEPLVEDWKRSLESARAVAGVSPWLFRARPRLRDEAELFASVDFVTRHSRPLARRVAYLSRDGVARLALADLLEESAHMIRLLGRATDDEAARYAARPVALALAARLDPGTIAGIAEQTVVVQLRPLVVDVLIALGVPATEARAALPSL
jgi:uncharacterized membrane protein YgaE (UPF0421/DUF939 family)